MSAPRGWRIRTRIALLVVACVLPAWLATGYMTFENYRQNRARIENFSATAARRLMLVVERELAGVAGSLQALATSPSIDQRDLPAFDAQARQVRTLQRGLNILLIDLEGQQLVNTSRPLGQALPKEKHSAFMLRVMDTAKPGITNLFYGPVLKKYLVALVVPVLRDDTVTAFLSMSLDASHLGDFLNLQHFPQPWQVTVYDAVGRVIAGGEARELSLDQKAPAELMTALQSVVEGSFRHTTAQGRHQWVTYQKSATYGWITTVAVSDDYLRAELVKALWLQAAGAAVVLLIGLALARHIGRSISEPIRALVEPALALGRGEPITLPPLTLREVADVGHALLLTQALLLQRGHERDLARSQSITDVLTGLSNRRHFDEVLQSELLRVHRSGVSLSLIMLDVDHFKKFNDTYGHVAGDDCLRRIGTVIASQINRNSDIAARYGGEEFALVLPDTDCQGAAALAERIRSAVNDLAIAHRNSSAASHVTVSLGVATVTSNTVNLVALADSNLYKAKAGGRNRVVTDAPQLPLPDCPAQGISSIPQ
ncbi:MAG: diguanylate cyclase [Rhodoferax sp.]